MELLLKTKNNKKIIISEMNKTLLFALAGVLLLGATTYLVASQKGNNLRDASLEQEWKAFKKTYGKKYADPAVDNYRMEVFAMNL